MGLNTVDKQTGGITAYREVTLSLDTSAYADGDLLADVQEIEDAVRIEVGTGILESIILQDNSDQAAALDLFITSLSTTWGTENDAWNISDTLGEAIQYHTEIAAADYYDMLNSQRVQIDNIGVGVKAASGSASLYVAAVSRGTPTYAADGLKLKIAILVD